jgi:hypothetical protein
VHVRGTFRQHLTQPLRILLPQLAVLLEPFLQRCTGVRLHRHITLLAKLADDVNCSSYPVDVARGVDAADLVEAATGPERESNEALEARGSASSGSAS